IRLPAIWHRPRPVPQLRPTSQVRPAGLRPRQGQQSPLALALAARAAWPDRRFDRLRLRRARWSAHQGFPVTCSPSLNPKGMVFFGTSPQPPPRPPEGPARPIRFSMLRSRLYKPVKHELGWADYQVRAEQAIVRHWQLVLLAYTCSLLVGTLPTAT